jgi:hypothetical protein
LSTEVDAVARYVEMLNPYARLDYYDVDVEEKSLLRAMLGCSRGTGFVIHVEIKTLARKAGLSEKTARRRIQGYTSKNGTKVPGLMARGILSQTAPSNYREARPATYRINWEAFTIDARQIGDLEQKLQTRIPFPGMKMPPEPDAHNLAKPVETAEEDGGKNLPLAVTASPPGGQVVHAWRSPRPSPAVTATAIGVNSGVDLCVSSSSKTNNNSCAAFERGAVEISKSWSSAPRSSWATLHPGIRARISRELERIAEAHVGMNTHGWTAEQFARHRAGNMRTACVRAEIWKHVTEDLVAEVYIAAVGKDSN